MAEPIAFKLRKEAAPSVHAISLDKAIGSRLGAASIGTPAILAVSNVALLEQMEAGVFDAANARVLADGDWENALLLVMPEGRGTNTPAIQETDQAFLAHVQRVVPELNDLGSRLIKAIRDAGVEGELRLEGHRWVNRPLNTFTLAVQTRVKNFQFTLYGGPERFGVTDFIKSDQNGYSRGWVRSEADIQTFVELAQIAYARKVR